LALGFFPPFLARLDFFARDEDLFFPRVPLAFDLRRADEADDFDFLGAFFLPPFFAAPLLRFLEPDPAFFAAAFAVRFAGLGAFFATALAPFFTGAAD